MKNARSVVGADVLARGSLSKVTGEAKYVDDLVLPGLLWARILGSRYANALVKSIDLTEANQIPGVRAILTADSEHVRCFRSNFTRDAPPIRDRARCIGDIIGVVAADTVEIADRAIGRIRVDYEILPVVLDHSVGLSPEAPLLFPEGNSADAGGKPTRLEYGDVVAGLTAADLVVEGTFGMSKVAHAAVEPRACIATWEDGRPIIWTATQTPYYVRQFVAEYFQLSADSVTVCVPGVGGGFGGKYQEEHIILATLLSRVTASPVKLVYTRDMEGMIGRARYAAETKISVGVKQDGTITAQDIEQCYDVGAYGSADGGSGETMAAVNASVYRTENLRMVATNVHTNTVTAQKFRSVYVPTYRFAVETVMDMIEERLGLLPGDLRVEKTVLPGEPIRPYGNVMGRHALRSCLLRAKQEMDFDKKWRGWNEPVSVGGSRRKGLGIGIGVGWCDWYRERHEGTTVRLSPDGDVVIETGVTDIGTGNLTAIAQIVAETLGYSSGESISVVSPNTIDCRSGMPGWDEGTIASRTLFVGGWAAMLAAAEIRRSVLAAAAERLKVDASRLQMRDGTVVLIDEPMRSVRLRDVISGPVAARGVPPESIVVGRAKRYQTYIAPVQVHIAEVEVDIETWETRIIDYVAACDSGTLINPLLARSQVEGGIVLGISTCLYEELVIDARDGRCLNSDFLDYKVALINDIPPLRVVMLEDAPAEYGPFGAKGIGEHPLPPVYGAIANAVYNATGIRPCEIPITPERLYRQGPEGRGSEETHFGVSLRAPQGRDR